MKKEKERVFFHMMNYQDELSQLININNLSVRAENVLLQNVGSIEELLSLDEEKILNLRNCGRKTVQEILAFQDTIRSDRFIPIIFSEKQPSQESQPSPSIADKLKEAPSEESLSLLPLFSSFPLFNINELEITPDDLHPEFYASTKLSDLALSRRTANVLYYSGIETLGELILTSGYSLLRKKNFGRNSLAELKDIVRSICLKETSYNSGNSTQIDYSSYKSMISTFLQQSGISKHQDNKRNEDIIFKRFCFQEGKVPTLEELGQDFGITRERARQILLKATTTLQIKSNLDKLSYFWERFDSIVTQGGGMIHLGSLPAALQAEFNWSNPPYYRALGQLLILREPDANLKEESNLVTAQSTCLNCDVPLKYLLSLDFDSINCLHIKVLAVKLSSHCQNNCYQNTNPSNHPVTTFHKAFIEHLIDKSGDRFALHNNLVSSYDKWLVKYSGKLEGIIC
ncbi:MAG: hypothetical protein HQK67_05560, partial [Desulfamplus sp.]|nr:hypothetical protein [Desulfamplus sp.]